MCVALKPFKDINYVCPLCWQNSNLIAEIVCYLYKYSKKLKTLINIENNNNNKIEIQGALNVCLWDDSYVHRCTKLTLHFFIWTIKTVWSML